MIKHMMSSKGAVLAVTLALLLSANVVVAQTDGVPPKTETATVKTEAVVTPTGVSAEGRAGVKVFPGEVKRGMGEAVRPMPVPAVKEVRNEIKNTRQDARAEMKDAREGARDEVKVMRTDAVNAIKEAKKATVGEVKEMRGETRSSVKEMREKAEGELKTMMANASTTREKMQKAVSEKRDEMKKELETRRTEMKTMVTAKQEEFKQKLDLAKQTVKTEISAKRAELKVKLQTVKDERKKQAVERVDTELERINGKQVENFTQVLNRLDEILGKIISRTEKAEGSGRDVSAVKTAISTAQSAMTLARESVAMQAGKSYAITITTEDALKSAVESARQALRADLTAVQGAVKSAHEALRTVATTLAGIPGINTLEDTSSPETVPVTN